MKFLLCIGIVIGLAGCRQSVIQQAVNTNTSVSEAAGAEVVSPRDYQICINTLKSGDDEDALIRCRQVSKEIKRD